MRYGFITCVELGRACIDEILAIGGHLEFLGTLHDDLARSKSGRTYIDDLAARANVELHKFDHVNSVECKEALAEADLDWLFIVGWSQIAGREVLDIPRRGVLGMHPTLLPEGRGRAAVPWAILKGLDRTGVTLFRLAEGVDTGEILAQVVIEIRPRETATTLYDRVVTAHRTLVRQAWPELEADSVELVAQEESLASVWPGRRPEDGLLHPATQTVEMVDRHVRALTYPYPGAFINTPAGQLKIWAGHPSEHDCSHAGAKIACSDGSYCIERTTLSPRVGSA